MIDYHCHILPALDDGAETLEEALEMARILVGFGVETVYCTPHCIPGYYDNTPEIIETAVLALQREIDQADINLKLQPGMEYYLDEKFPQAMKNPRPLGESGMLLVEAPSQGDPQQVRLHLQDIVRAGFTPLFAHPERYGFLAQRDEPGLLGKAKRLLAGKGQAGADGASIEFIEELQKTGCKLQGNLGSFAGHYGPQARQQAKLFHQMGYYHLFGSDGHSPAQLREVFARGFKYIEKSI